MIHIILFLLLVFSSSNLSAQTDSADRKKHPLSIEITTNNYNTFKGLLVSITDSSVFAYPGKKKEWRKSVQYTPVEFNINQVQQITIKKTNRLLIGLSGGATFGVGALLGSRQLFGTKNNVYKYAIPLVPLSIIIGGIIGLSRKTKVNLSGSKLTFLEIRGKYEKYYQR